MKTYSVFILLLVSASLYAQQPPGSEIYLVDLSVKKASVTITNPTNITSRPGYDNQPYFHPNQPLLYFSSAGEDGRTDIKVYNFKTHETAFVTKTAEREYSPTVTPDGNSISCIIQRDNGAQDLGRYPINGGNAEVLINELIVGYHAWINENQLLLFVLGDTMALQRYTLDLKKGEIVAKQIGRSLHKIPKSKGMSFIHKVSEQEWQIRKLNSDGSIETITSTLPKREDIAWLPDGKIIMSDGKNLFYYWPGKTTAWQPITVPSTMPGGTITRLAVNKKGNLLAMVVSE